MRDAGHTTVFSELRYHSLTVAAQQDRSGMNTGFSKESKRRGQSLVEAALVLFVFFALLLGIADCGQVLFAHQALVERARSASRWGVLHPWQGPEPIVNLVLYGQTQEPPIAGSGYLGMTPANVRVEYRPATPDRPDDETLSVAVVNFESHLFSPWLARELVSARPVLVSAPMASATAKQLF